MIIHQLDGDGSAGVLVKVLSGNLKKDVIEFASSSSYLGKTDYPFLGADKYPQVPLRCIAATTGATVLLASRLIRRLRMTRTVKNSSITRSRADELTGRSKWSGSSELQRVACLPSRTVHRQHSAAFVPGYVGRCVSATAGKMAWC